MSTTTTTTESEKSTVPMPTSSSSTVQPPEVRIFHRVASIPLISSLLSTVDTNSYTHSAYTRAKDLSTSVYKYTEPLQTRMAPLIVRADGYANMGLDVVESHFPYAFQAKPEDVTGYVRQKRESASEYVRVRRDSATKTIDERVRTPAYAVAENIDQSFAPIVSYFESKLNSEGKPYTPAESKYQYQRAIALSNHVREQVYVYSNEHIKDLQEHNALVQKATETAQSLNQAVLDAQARVQALSDAMLAELQKIQSSAAQLAASVQSTASSVPPQVQQVYNDFSANVSSTITEFKDILSQKDVPFQEKASTVGTQVRERITPLLENGRKAIQDIIARGRASDAAVTANGINGHAQ